MYVRVRVNVLRADLREGERDVPPMSSRGDVEKGMDGYAQVYLSWTDRQTDRPAFPYRCCILICHKPDANYRVSKSYCKK